MEFFNQFTDLHWKMRNLTRVVLRLEHFDPLKLLSGNCNFRLYLKMNLSGSLKISLDLLRPFIFFFMDRERKRGGIKRNRRNRRMVIDLQNRTLFSKPLVHTSYYRYRYHILSEIQVQNGTPPKKILDARLDMMIF